MNLSFANQAALVTGAASGLGLATARASAGSGAAVVLADCNEKAVRAAAELAAKGHQICRGGDGSRRSGPECSGNGPRVGASACLSCNPGGHRGRI